MKFQVGDRVRAYESVDTWTGTIEEIDKDGLIILKENEHIIFHHKQCRKLKPKKGRRRIWLNVYHANTIDLGAVHSTKFDADQRAGAYRIDCIEFIEVRKK